MTGRVNELLLEESETMKVGTPPLFPLPLRPLPPSLPQLSTNLYSEDGGLFSCERLFLGDKEPFKS